MLGKIKFTEDSILFYPFLFEKDTSRCINLLELQPFREYFHRNKVGVYGTLEELIFIGLELRRAISGVEKEKIEKLYKILRSLSLGDFRINSLYIGREYTAELKEKQIILYFKNKECAYSYNTFAKTYCIAKKSTLKDLLKENLNTEIRGNRIFYFFSKSPGSYVLMEYKHNTSSTYYIGVWSGKTSMMRGNKKYVWENFAAGLKMLNCGNIEGAAVFSFFGLAHFHTSSNAPLAYFCVGDTNYKEIKTLTRMYNNIKVSAEQFLADLLSYIRDGKRGEGIKKLEILSKILHEVWNGITTEYEGDPGYPERQDMKAILKSSPKPEIKPKTVI